MGYENLSLDSRAFLMEAARLSYGANQSDPRKGGSGRMGVLLGPDNTARVIKFNTHWTERWFGPSKSEVPQMLDSANELRRILVDVAYSAGLSDAKVQAIRDKLGLDGSSMSSDKLLDRKTVASVVTMIGGESVWEDALRDPTDPTRQRNMAEYRSDANAGFRDLMSRDVTVSHNVKSVVKLDRMAARECEDLLNEVRYLHLDSQLDLEEPAEPDGQGARDAADDNVLAKACRKAFGGGFFDEIEHAHVLVGKNKDKLSEELGRMFDTLLGRFRAGEFEQMDVDKLASTVRTNCLDVLTNDWNSLKIGEFGLLGQDIELLRDSELLPGDLEKIAPNDLGLDVRERMIVLKSIAVHAAVQLRHAEQNARQGMVNSIKKRIMSGQFVGSVVGALLAASKTVDFESYLTDVRQGNKDGLGRFGLTDQDKSAKINGLFGKLRPSLFAGMSDRDSWRSFVRFLSGDNFRFLTLERVPTDKAINCITTAVKNLPHEDVVILRESKFDLVGFLIDKPVSGLANGHVLAEAVRRCQANGAGDLQRKVGDCFDRFWTTVTPERVLGGDARLSDDEKEIFRIIACRYPDAGLATGDDQGRACRRIQEEYRRVMDCVSMLAGNFAPEESVIHALASYDVNSSQLFKALSVNDLDALLERAHERFELVSQLSGDFQEFANQVEGSDLIDQPLTPKRFLDIKNGTFLDFFILDMFNPRVDTKYVNRLNARKIAFDTYCNLYDKTVTEIDDGGETNELRAKKFAADIMRRCLANINVKHLETPERQEFFFGRVFELCKREDGPIAWLDQCAGILRDPSLSNEDKIQVIKENLWKTAKLFVDECWGCEANFFQLYGVSKLEELGNDEMVSGLSETMQAVLNASLTKDGQTVDSLISEVIRTTPVDRLDGLADFAEVDKFDRRVASRQEISAHGALKCFCIEYADRKRTSLHAGEVAPED